MNVKAVGRTLQASTFVLNPKSARKKIGKAASNFVTLMAFQLIFMIALIIMQLVRQESMDIILLQTGQKTEM